jgi:hypothetical protein
VRGLEDMLRKRDAGVDKVGLRGTLTSSKWGQTYPCLWEMLVTDHWEDGTPRTLSTLTIFVDDDQVKLCLNDRAQGLTGWASGSSVEEALKALESGLKEDTIEWRRSSAGGKGKKGK